MQQDEIRYNLYFAKCSAEVEAGTELKMYGGGNSRFWHRHPIAGIIFLVVIGAGFVGWVVGVLHQGSFIFGGHAGRGGIKVTRAAMPFQFWLGIVSAFIMAICIFSCAVHKLHRYRRRLALRPNVKSR